MKNRKETLLKLLKHNYVFKIDYETKYKLFDKIIGHFIK